MNDDSLNPSPPLPPEPANENEQRRETMLAYYLGALEPDQEALVRGRIETSPEWQSARLEAKSMLAGLKRDGTAAGTAPSTLAERTLERLRSDGKPSENDATNGKAAEKTVAVARRTISKPKLSPPRSLTQTRRVFAGVFALCLAVLGVMWVRNALRSDSAPAIYWRTDSTLAAGGPFAPMLQIRDATSGAPVEAKISATLIDTRDNSTVKDIGSAQTDETGTAPTQNWRVPAVPAGDYTLRIEARSASGIVLDSANQRVKVVGSNRLALAPDRTQARPGETIRVRALALSTTGQTPVRNAAIAFDILDPRGNRINRVETHTSNFGLAWAEFPLDTAAPEGSYKLTAVSEGLSAERTVNVKQYTLPAFQAAITPAKTWFKKNEAISGSVEASTFDGQRIADATCDLTLMDLAGRNLGQLKLDASRDGRAAFTLPWSSTDDADHFVLVLHTKWTDGAGRIVESNKPVPVASSALLLSAIAEAQELVPGVANRVYVLARDPEGRGVKSHLTIRRGANAQEVDTDASGVATITLENPARPAEVLEVVDQATGVARRVSLPIRAEKDGRLLVRTDRAIVQGGQSLKATVLCGAATSPSNSIALLALRKDGNTIASRGVKLSGASTDVRFDIPTGSAGLYSLETSLQSASGDVWTDRRAVLITSSSDIRVVASADRPEYKPGQRARLSFQVSDAMGKSVPAAVSVVAVDQALLALTGDNPGLAQALLNKESGALMHVDLPLDAREFGPAQGDSPAALAALARATGNKDSAELAPENETKIIDRGDHYRATVLLEKQRATDTIGYFGIAILSMGIIFFLTLTCLQQIGHNYSKRHELTPLSIVALTTLVILATLALLVFIPTNYKELCVVLIWITLVISHVALLRDGMTGAPEFLAAKCYIAVLFSDIYLLLAAYVALQMPHHDSPVAAFLILGAIPVLFTQLTRVVSPNLMRVGIGFAGVFLVFGFLILSTGSIQMEMKSADAPFNSKATANAKPMPMSEVTSEPEEIVQLTANRSDASPTRPHLRWDFPETMIFAPELITDENGNASFELNVADSLTRWRVQADAVARSGGVAQTQSSLIVTQPFSADLILPASVTAGDVLHVPAVVSNHTKTEQHVDVSLELTGAIGVDGLTRQVTVAPDASAAADFVVRFAAPGSARFHVTARPMGLAAADADAIERSLTVVPDGQAVAFTASSLVTEKSEFTVQVPDGAIPGTIHAALTVHRGPLTQMIEGLDGMLQEPHGCFEQTSSSTYPNIMILRYLKAHEVNNPVVMERARRLIEAGYQRLLSFEVNGRSGSFSLFGHAPASTWLTAYGLQEFNDMAAVFPVDPALLARMRTYLKTKMRADGSFDVDEYHGDFGGERGLAATAYVVQALGDDAPAESIRYLSNRRDEIARDPYLCALCANALLRADHATASQLAARLPGLAKADPLSKTATLAAKSSLAWGYGNTATTESTALGALALLQTGQDPDAARLLLAGLQGRGGWGSTHATVLALKALECAAGRTHSPGATRVVVEVNGDALPVIDMKAEETGVPVSIPLTLPKGKSTVRVQVSGGTVVTRAAGNAWVPWTETVVPAASSPLRVTTDYDSTALTKNRTVLGTMNVSAKGRRAEVPMVEWGLAAGFSPDSTDLEALKQRGAITRWEVSGRSLHLYLPNLDDGKNATLSVRFTPTASGSLSAQPSRAYEYYSAADAVTIKPAKFEVK